MRVFALLYDSFVVFLGYTNFLFNGPDVYNYAHSASHPCTRFYNYYNFRTYKISTSVIVQCTLCNNLIIYNLNYLYKMVSILNENPSKFSVYRHRVKRPWVKVHPWESDMEDHLKIRRQSLKSTTCMNTVQRQFYPYSWRISIFSFN